MLSRRNFSKLAGSTMLGSMLPPSAMATSLLSPLSVSNPLNWSATKMAQAIRQGELSSVELVRASYKRIEEVNANLNAIVQMRKQAALADAARADKALAAGQHSGPLHGVPFTLKDSFDTFDMITTAGTSGRANYLPQADATVARRLREAGGILLGKSNTPALTLSGETDNRVYGRTNNPLDLTRTPGGSSGGAAAIIASMASPFDIGTDTGGSIRWPAHCCGIQGFKPTSGRVPRTGHIVSYAGQLQALTQPGPLARSVDDLILLTKIIAGEDNIDPHVISRPFSGLQRRDVKDLRIAWYSSNKMMPPSSDIVEVIEGVANTLQQNGAIVSEALPESVTNSHHLMVELALGDISWVEELLAETDSRDSPLLPSLASLSQSLNARPMARLMEEWDYYRSDMLAFMQDYDLILCPIAPTTAPLHGEFTMETGSYLTVYNLAGWPAASIRAGSSKDKLPINVQIVGRPWADGAVLSLARWLEHALAA